MSLLKIVSLKLLLKSLEILRCCQIVPEEKLQICFLSLKDMCPPKALVKQATKRCNIGRFYARDIKVVLRGLWYKNGHCCKIS